MIKEGHHQKPAWAEEVSNVVRRKQNYVSNDGHRINFKEVCGINLLNRKHVMNLIYPSLYKIQNTKYTNTEYKIQNTQIQNTKK